jgi:hypothetical protein
MVADDAVAMGRVDLEERDIEAGVRVASPDLAPLPRPELHARLALANWTAEERRLDYRLTKDGFDTVGKKGRTRIRWPAIHRFAEGPDSFVIQASETMRTVIPKRAFAGDDIPTVRAMLTEWVTPRPSTQKPATGRRVKTVVLWMVLVVLFLAVWQFVSTPR